MTSSLRIVVSGLAGTYPYGGVFWDYLQYPLGLKRLGHDVLYIEDTGKWCYDAQARTFRADGTANAAFLGRRIAALDPALADSWFMRDSCGATFGRAWQDVVEFCRTADLFLHVSGSCWLREEHLAARRIAFIDSDPMYTQAALLAGTADEAAARLDWWQRQHDVFFTFGENIHGVDCRIPSTPIQWIPTRQPIVLECFDAMTMRLSSRRRVLTTVASWEPAEESFDVGGVRYCGKSVEFNRFLRLPSRSAIALEVAMSGLAPLDVMRREGWQVVDAFDVSRDPWQYLTYLANSLGEWSVAKQAYVASRSGWFSCRSACYLALGVPVIVQDTGFSGHIPVGDGVLTFTTVDEAAGAIDRLLTDPEGHSRAAREIAHEYFDSRRVLSRLIESAMDPRLGPRGTGAASRQDASDWTRLRETPSPP